MHQISLFASDVVSEVKYEYSQTRIRADLPESYDPGYGQSRSQDLPYPSFPTSYSSYQPTPHYSMAPSASSTVTRTSMMEDPRYAGQYGDPYATPAYYGYSASTSSQIPNPYALGGYPSPSQSSTSYSSSVYPPSMKTASPYNLDSQAYPKAPPGPPGPGIRWDDPYNPGIYGDTRPSERPREVSGGLLYLFSLTYFRIQNHHSPVGIGMMITCDLFANRSP